MYYPFYIRINTQNKVMRSKQINTKGIISCILVLKIFFKAVKIDLIYHS